MTPDERQLLSGLFDRIRSSSQQPRDRDAESFIGDAVKTQPYAPYLLAQTVIVQEQALRAAHDRLQELEAKVQQQAGTGGGDTSFLGNIGRSLFGGGDPQPQSRQPTSAPNYPPASQGSYSPNQGGYPQQPQQGPWGQANQGAPAQGGGFLKGALGAAAGVAGGVLLADTISGLFRGNNQYGIASGVPGFGGGGFGGGYPGGGGETIVNNYYEGDGSRGDDVGRGQNFDSGNDGGNFDPTADLGPDDGGFGSDDSYNV